MGLVNNQKAYDRYLLNQESGSNIIIHGERIGFSFEIRMPNFRGNYLSCIEELIITVNDRVVDEKTIELCLNGKRFAIHELSELYKEYWDVLDFARIEVFREGGLTGMHRIGVTMRLRYGYSAYFGVCKVVTSKCEKPLSFD